jgi:membrane protein YdbS with pleckstrin-like domain
MAFLIILIVLFVASIFGVIIFSRINLFDRCEALFGISLIILIASIVFLILIPILRYQNNAEIEEIKAFELTINEGLENKTEIERAAILTEITKINRSIARAKYINSTFWGDIFIPDSFCELDYLK